MYYRTSSLESVAEFKYHRIIIQQNNTFGRALEHICQQSKKTQAVLDLHIHIHPTCTCKSVSMI